MQSRLLARPADALIAIGAALETALDHLKPGPGEEARRAATSLLDEVIDELQEAAAIHDPRVGRDSRALAGQRAKPAAEAFLRLADDLESARWNLVDARDTGMAAWEEGVATVRSSVNELYWAATGLQIAALAVTTEALD